MYIYLKLSHSNANICLRKFIILVYSFVSNCWTYDQIIKETDLDTSEEDSDDSEDIFARRNRKAVKYNCDTSDEESDMGIARICVNVQDVPRKSVNAEKVPSSKLARSTRDDNLRKSVSSTKLC